MNARAMAMAVLGLVLAAAPGGVRADDKTKEAKVKCAGISANGAVLQVTAKECKDHKGTVVFEKAAPAPKPAPGK